MDESPQKELEVLPEVAPVLHADGLVLRPWTFDDADEVVVLADDGESRRWSPSMRTIASPADAQAWIRARLARRTDWAVVDPATGRLAGRVGLHHFDLEHGVAEVGYGVSAAFRGHGVARRAVAAVTAYGFGGRTAGPSEGLGLARIELMHATGNIASCRVARASGYAPEGTARSGMTDGAGGRDDLHRHARLVDDPDGPLPLLVPASPVEVAAGPYQLCAPDVEQDAPVVVEAAADELIARWNALPTDLDDARAWVARRGDWTDGMHASWTVREAVGGALVGGVSLFQVDPVALAAQAGYWTVPAARGRGVAPAALAAAARYGYGALGLERVELFHAVENHGSCRTAEKAGFALEGRHRRSHRYGDGLLHDEHCHARLAGD